MPSFHPVAGVTLHMIGGLAAASFYLPYRKVRGWLWERTWLTGGFWSWMVAPWVFALVLVPAVAATLAEAPLKVLFWSWFFGMLWGIGGLTYGLTMRFLGLALGNAVALGLCAFFGTVVPPLYYGTAGAMLAEHSGRTVLIGLALSVAGIFISGRAGVLKEREMAAAPAPRAPRGEFNLWKGMMVAVICGLMSACMAFGFAAGTPIAQIAVHNGASNLWQNLPVLIVVLFGGFCTNAALCGVQIYRHRARKRDRLPAHGGEPGLEAHAAPARLNHLLCAAAGLTWYLQFFFYGMGTTQLGRLNAASWPLHMASIILFGTLWGITLREWKGTSRAARGWISAGLAVLVLSIAIIGFGNR